MGYTDACGVVDVNSTLIATRGINEKGQKGAWKRVFKATSGFKFANIDAMKDQGNWDAAVAAGNLTYLGEGKFDDQSTEATFFEDTSLNFRKKQQDATKVLGFQLLVCDCTNSELLKADGQSAEFFFQTDSQYVVGRLEDDGQVSGLAADLTVTLRSVPTDDTPAEYSRLVFSFTDPKGDELNPCSPKIDFLFSEVDQIGRADYKIENISTSGSALDFDLTLYESCSTTKLEGALEADFNVEDTDGNVLAIATFSEATGVYSFSITTALTLAYVELDGIKTVNSLLYVTDRIRVSV